MSASSWHNGNPNNITGAGFGLRINTAFRNTHFNPAWHYVRLYLRNYPHNPVIVRLSPSFWRKCPELRSKHIGLWFIMNGYNSWAPYQPHRFILRQVGNTNIFYV